MTTIDVIVVEPGQTPCLEAVEPTLKAYQAIVGGDIERIPVPNWPESLYVVGSDAGRLKKLPKNQFGIFGTFFVCAYRRDDLDGLTPGQMATAVKLLNQRRYFALAKDGRHLYHPQDGLVLWTEYFDCVAVAVERGLAVREVTDVEKIRPDFPRKVTVVEFGKKRIIHTPPPPVLATNPIRFGQNRVRL